MSRLLVISTGVLLLLCLVGAGCGAGSALESGTAPGSTFPTTPVPATEPLSATSSAGTGSSSTTSSISTVTTTARWPEQIQAVLGTSVTLDSKTNTVWRVTADGVIARELRFVPYDGSVAFGELAGTLVYSESDTSTLHAWRPGEVAPNDLFTLELPDVGNTAGDMIALSPDERLLAIGRLLPAPGGPDFVDATITRGYLVDLETGQIDRWDWLDSAAGGEIVTALTWGKTTSAVYVSIGYHGGSQGDWSYRYDVSTGEAVELTGVATVFDVGLQDQVVGLGMPASSAEFEYPAGSQYGIFPLVVWQEGVRSILPRDTALVEWGDAWISDDGCTIVVSGDATAHPGRSKCLEVLRLEDAGWAVSGLLLAEDSFSVVGGAFEPDSHTFWFQAGSDLFALDTDACRGDSALQLTPSVELPGSPDCFHGVGIAWAECSGGT